MSVDELDRRLEKWQKDTSAASANLAALEASSSYQMLKASLSKLTGKTKIEIGAPIAEMDAIWEHFSLLNKAVNDAAELRKTMPQMFGRGDHIQKIEQLLSGQSIVLKTKEVPLAERGLTGASQKVETCTPKELFDKMQHTFVAGTKAADLYEKSYFELTEKVGAAYAELDKANDSAQRAKLDGIRDLIDTDPLSGLEQLKGPKKQRTKAAPSEPKAPPKIEVKEVKAVTPAPQPPVAPKVTPAPPAPPAAPSRMVHDPKVNRLVATEGLDALDRLILTKTTPKATEPSKPTPSKKLEDLFDSPPKKGTA